MKRGKKYVEAAKNIDRQTLYEATEAVSLVKKSAVAKFDETIEAHIRTGCDGRHAEQQAEVDYALGNMTNTHELGVYQQKANIALQYTVAIRDKALEAYKEIMNMQI